MKLTFFAIVATVILLGSTSSIRVQAQPGEDLKTSGDRRIEFTVPDAPWSLTLPKANLVVNRQEIKADRRSGYFLLTDEKNQMTISFFIEAVKDCKNSKACRDMIRKLGNPAWEDAQKFEQYEIGDVSYLELFVPSFRGAPVKQQNVYAEFVKDGFWVDLHISKVLYKPEHHSLFEQIIKSIKFEPKNSQTAAQK